MSPTIDFPFFKKRDYFLFLIAICCYVILFKNYKCYTKLPNHKLLVCIIYELTQYLVHLFLLFYLVYLVYINTSAIRPSPHQILYVTSLMSMVFLLARELCRLYKTGFVVENKAFIPVAAVGYLLFVWIGRQNKKLPYTKSKTLYRQELIILSLMSFMIGFIISFGPIYMLDYNRMI